MNELDKLVKNFSNYTCFFFLSVNLLTIDQGRRRSLDFLQNQGLVLGNFKLLNC